MPDVVVVSETWLSPDIFSVQRFFQKVFPEGYRIFRKDRPDGYGGMLLTCSDTFTCSEIYIDSQSEIVVCQLTLTNKPSVQCIDPLIEKQNLLRICVELLRAFALCIQIYIPIWIAGYLSKSPKHRLRELLHS